MARKPTTAVVETGADLQHPTPQPRRRPRSSRGVSLACGLALLILAGGALPLAAQTPPSILLLVMDDVGIEHLGFYGLGLAGFAETLDLDAWVNLWLRFDDAWSDTECSPTRALIQTGRFGFRTGVGRVVNCDASRGMDVTDPNLLAKLLAAQGYATAAFGKWHMGTDPASFPSQCDGLDAPLEAGFDSFEGVILDQQEGLDPETIYETYVKTTISDPVADCPTANQTVNGYQTKDFAQAAATWISQQPAGTPWFAYVAFTAAHEPFHCPPAALYPTVTFNCTPLPDDPPPPDTLLYRDMIEALSVDLDIVVSAAAGIEPEDPVSNPENTLVILVGDNGSPPEVAVDPVDPTRAKSTVFQGGVRVPFLLGGELVNGPAVAEEGEIVGHVDLYATVLEVAGVDTSAFTDDSEDLAPYFTNPAAAVRSDLYTEWFFPNFDPGTGEGPSQGQQAIRDTRYKYLRNTAAGEGFFDLEVDPWETDNLLPLPINDPLGFVLRDLKDKLEVLLPGGLLSICTKEPVGGPCGSNDDCCSRTCNQDECINPQPPTLCQP